MLNIKNDNENINYVGNFEIFTKEGEIIKYSQNKGDYVELNFTGNKVRFYTHTNAWRGKANIYIDNIKVGTIDYMPVLERVEAFMEDNGIEE